MSLVFNALATVFVGALIAIHSSALAQTEYHLAVGDRLSFSLVGTPDVEREIVINLDGKVFLPLIGSVEAKGLSLAELRNKVAAIVRRSPIRTSDSRGDEVWRGIQPNEVVLNIADYRPVYVSGNVERPGQLDFRPGMTVRQALVRAGGIKTLDDAEDLRIVEAMARRDRYRRQISLIEDRLRRLQQDLQRISGADPSPSSTSAAPAFDGEHDGSGDVYSFDEINKDWLAARKNLRQAEQSGQAAELKKLQKRLGVLQELKTVGQERVQVEEDNVERIRRLADRGIATTDRLNEARQDLLQASSRALDTAEDVLQLQVRIVQAREEAETDEIEEAVDLLDRIETETAKLGEVRSEFETLNRYLETIGTRGSSTTSHESLVHLYRGTLSGAKKVADLDTAVMPGDVIEVVLRRRDATE